MPFVPGGSRGLRSWLSVFGLAACALTARPASGDDWPQWQGPQRDGVWRETGILSKFPAEGPIVRWRTPIGGGYAGPAVAGGRVYVTDRVLGEGSRNPANQFQRGNVAGVERVLCLDEADGKLLWKHEYPCPYTVSYPAGPRTTPVVQDGKVYTLGAEGHLLCLEAKTGKVEWSRDLKKDYAMAISAVWGFSSNPLLDGKKLICLVGGAGTTVVTFDKDTGKELWRALNSSGGHGPGYGSPILIEAGGRRQLIVWHTEAVSSLDPETGGVFWEQPFRIQQGQTVPTPRQHGELLFVTGFYDGSMMLRLGRDRPAASVVWQRKGQSERNTDALHSVICTPFLEEGHIYGVCSYGQLRCLKADTGDRLWETFQATGAAGNGTDRWATAFIVKNSDRFFLFNEKGDLIIARLSPKGYEEISRAHILEPTNTAQRRDVIWSHPAFANRCCYTRNDKEIVCVSLAQTAIPDKKPQDAPKAHAFPRPVGIFSVGLRRQPPPMELLEKPFVDGVTIAEGWVYAEPNEGKYDFSTIEKALAAVEPYQKKLTICLFPFPVPNWLNIEPKVQTYKVPHAGPGFTTPVPWDERGLARWEGLCKALSEHKVPDRAQIGKTVALRDHPLLFAVHCWPMGMNGIRDIAMVSGRDTPLHATPYYSRKALTTGILRSTHAMVDHFPRQFHCLPFFRIQDKTASPSLDQHLVQALKTEFWSGQAAPQLGLLQENLSAGGPNATGGSVLIQQRANTYIMLQAIESWAKPTQGFAGAVRQGSPADAIGRGYEIFDCRYFEIYMNDLLHADYAAGFEKWHAFLHRGGPRPASANTPVAGKTPSDGNSGSLKSVDVEKNTITLTVGEKDQVYSVTKAKLLRPDGQEVAGGLKSVQGFLDRQAVLVTVKTEQKNGDNIVTEVRLQPRGK